MASLVGLRPEPGRTRLSPLDRARTRGRAFDDALSSIRTVTVGPGTARDLLPPPPGGGRSRACALARAYRRWGLPPRPENACSDRLGAAPAWPIGTVLGKGLSC